MRMMFLENSWVAVSAQAQSEYAYGFTTRNSVKLNVAISFQIRSIRRNLLARIKFETRSHLRSIRLVYPGLLSTTSRCWLCIGHKSLYNNCHFYNESMVIFLKKTLLVCFGLT